MLKENRYIDTRGNGANAKTFAEVLVEGLAEGGGLYVPETIPLLSLSEIEGLAALPYAKQAAFIYKKFNTGLADADIDALMEASYGQNFDNPDICPITKLDEKTFMLELWHGPTSAFKDMALQCLPHFFTHSARVLKSAGKLENDFLILVATSGDTGKAALEGFCNIDGVKIGVLYPHGGVSDIQRKQMVTQQGNNVYVWAVEGNFDDCQTNVKRIFADVSFSDELDSAHNIALSSANSINWGRLLPQVIYYVSSYARLLAQGSIQKNQLLDICVPTGNFGNILAAWYAKQMGVPVGKLMCASNENCVLTDFLHTGTYTIVDRSFVLTPSPSMDILVSSNLERALFELSGRNATLIKEWMSALNTKREFSIDEQTFDAFKENFLAACVSNNECLSLIKDVYKTYDYLLDPHTAVAYGAAKKLATDNPVLIASTAHWAKFGNNVYKALHEIPAEENLPSNVASLSGCELNKKIASECNLDYIPKNLASLDEAEIRFTDVINANQSEIEKNIQAWLEKSE